MSDSSRAIGVVSVAALMTPQLKFEGIHLLSTTRPDSFNPYLGAIRGYLIQMIKSDAEKNELFLQPISYTVVYCPADGTILVYTRSSDPANYEEDRLMGLVSIGVGGHYELNDLWSSDPIRANLCRELKEEIHLTIPVDEKNIHLIGMIMDRSNEVGRVHFGLLSVVSVLPGDIKHFSQEFARGRMIKLDEILNYMNQPNVQPENWTVLGLPIFLRWLQGGIKHQWI